jgi:hypothetical protein
VPDRIDIEPLVAGPVLGNGESSPTGARQVTR